MIDGDHYDQLLTHLYQTVTEPDLWAPVLADLRDVFNGSAAALIMTAGGYTPEEVISTAPEAFAAFKNWSSWNPLNGPKRPAGAVLLDRDVIDRQQLSASDYYNHVLLPFDIPKVLYIKGLECSSTSSRDATLNILRGQHQHEYHPNDLLLGRRLSRHIVAALRSSSLLGWKATTELIASMDQAAEATILLDAEGRIRHINDAARRIAAGREGIIIEKAGLGAVRSTDRAQLQRAIARAIGKNGPRVSSLVTIGRPSGGRALIASIAPLAPVGDWLNPQARVLVKIVDPTKQRQPAISHLTDLFGLTKREAEIAQGLGMGMTIAEAAENCGVTLGTARNYLASVLQKTDLNRQGDLLLLLARIVSLPPAGEISLL